MQAHTTACPVPTWGQVAPREDPGAFHGFCRRDACVAECVREGRSIGVVVKAARVRSHLCASAQSDDPVLPRHPVPLEVRAVVHSTLVGRREERRTLVPVVARIRIFIFNRRNQGRRHGGGRGGHGPPTFKNMRASGGAGGASVLGGPGGAKTTGPGGAMGTQILYFKVALPLLTF